MRSSPNLSESAIAAFLSPHFDRWLLVLCSMLSAWFDDIKYSLVSQVYGLSRALCSPRRLPVSRLLHRHQLRLLSRLQLLWLSRLPRRPPLQHPHQHQRLHR